VQTGTIPPDQPHDERVVETEVKTIRKRQRVVGDSPDSVPSGSIHTSTGSYFETLPERMSAILLVILAGLEGLLGIRFMLRAYGANPDSGFVSFIDNVSGPFMRPFSSVFNSRTWDQGVLEISTLVAMGFYLLLFALIGMAVAALAPRLKGGPDGVA
jgi:YGGT family